MEMEDQHNHNQHHNCHDYGGFADLRQLMNSRGTHFPVVPQVAELFPGHRSLTLTPEGYHNEMLMVGRQVSELMARWPQDFTNINNNTNNTTSCAVVSTPSFSGFEGEAVGSFGGGTARWPRQETLTLLEIRSRLDSKFKEANQKGPLWDEVSRIMSEDHGYQRSGKKCREKFENLYKYYKKTKEGKAGRQDGKNYRFFRQLEALYGDSSNSVSVPETHDVGSSLRFHTATKTCNQANQELFSSHQKLCDNPSLCNSSEFNSSSSDNNDLSTMENDSTEKRGKKRGGRSWKIKIKEFIDSQMRKLMERQESWLHKLTTTLEQKEQERMLRDEDWRRQEEARIDREHKMWAKEKAWIEARDSALIEAIQNLTGKQLIKASDRDELMASQIQRQSENQNESVSQEVSEKWEECEVTRLIQLRTSMEERFQQSGCSQESVWEEIGAKMVCLGYDKNGLMCKEKWDSINNYMKKTNKKRKENSRSCSNYLMCNQGGGYCEINEEETETVIRLHQTNETSSPLYSNVGNAFLLADGDHLWENHGLKLSKGENSKLN